MGTNNSKYGGVFSTPKHSQINMRAYNYFVDRVHRTKNYQHNHFNSDAGSTMGRGSAGFYKKQPDTFGSGMKGLDDYKKV